MVTCHSTDLPKPVMLGLRILGLPVMAILIRKVLVQTVQVLSSEFKREFASHI